MEIKQFLKEGEKEFEKMDMTALALLIKNEDDRKLAKAVLFQFLDWHKAQIVEIINKTQIELCEEFSNTLLDERKNGWDWILKYKEKLLENIKE